MKQSKTYIATQEPPAQEKRRWSMLLLPLSLFLFLAFACNTGIDGPTETREDSFAVGDTVKIVVNGDNGSVTVNPGSDGDVQVNASLKNPDKLEYQVAQSGDTITIDAKSKRSGIFNFGDGPESNIEITAPSNARVELMTGNGAIKVNGMHQSGTARTSNGRVTLTNVTGEFDVSTSNGAVEITQAKGTFNLRSSNGKIEFDGEITGGSNRMTTSNGSIDVKLRGTPSIKLDASTSNGSVVSTIPVTISSGVDENHLVGTIGDGDAELIIQTSNGSVNIQ